MRPWENDELMYIEHHNTELMMKTGAMSFILNNKMLLAHIPASMRLSDVVCYATFDLFIDLLNVSNTANISCK